MIEHNMVEKMHVVPEDRVNFRHEHWTVECSCGFRYRGNERDVQTESQKHAEEFLHRPSSPTPVMYEADDGSTGECDEQQLITAWLREVFRVEGPPGTFTSVTFPVGYTMKYWMKND